MSKKIKKFRGNAVIQFALLITLIYITIPLEIVEIIGDSYGNIIFTL